MAITFSYNDVCQLEQSRSEQINRVLNKIGKEKWNNKPLNLRQLCDFVEDQNVISVSSIKWLLSVFFNTNKVSFEDKLKLILSTLDFILEKPFTFDPKDYGLSEMRELLHGHLNNSDKKSILIKNLEDKINKQKREIKKTRFVNTYVTFQIDMITRCNKCAIMILGLIKGINYDDSYAVLTELFSIGTNAISGDIEVTGYELYQNIKMNFLALTTD